MSTEKNRTNIEWTDFTWNVAVGCSKVDADCLGCYMYRDSFDGKRYDPKKVRKTKSVFNDPKSKTKIPSGSMVFTSSLTDFFHPAIDHYRKEAWDIIRGRPDLHFQILTKRPERIFENLPEDWGQGWNNVWMGTSCGSEKAFYERSSILWGLPAKTKFISFEPLHERIPMNLDISFVVGFDWVIIGGESGSYWNEEVEAKRKKKREKPKYIARPCRVEWMEEIAQEFGGCGVPVFVKQMGTVLSKELHMDDRHGRDFESFPPNLKIREFPNIYRDGKI